MNETTVEEKDYLLEGEYNPSSQVNEIYPNAEVRVSKVQYSTLHIKRLVEDRHELIIDPDFQRNSVWDRKQCSELIESILMGIPIPVMYLFEARDGSKQVVDGRQRISAILDFLNDKLVLRDMKILRKYNNLKFSQLDSKMQGIFEDSQMYFYIIQPPTSERVKYDIFDRVNRGGTSLTNQEMRNALYRGKSTRLLAELSSSEAFLNATGCAISPIRKKDQYVILRAVAFYLLFKRPTEVCDQNKEAIEYKSDIDDFLAKMMVFINEKASDTLIDECKAAFESAMSRSYDILGKDAFRFEAYEKENGKRKRRPINMPLFEMLFFVFSDPCVCVNPSITLQIVNNYKKSLDHQFVNNVDSSSNVAERYNISQRIIEQIKHDTQHID
ncbi:MAG: DUF262 domain-containing protein [Muribaculaceae bacterium]|nr:DUF262 domain-containing protein [Muribaculaceae bacterium]